MFMWAYDVEFGVVADLELFIELADQTVGLGN